MTQIELKQYLKEASIGLDADGDGQVTAEEATNYMTFVRKQDKKAKAMGTQMSRIGSRSNETTQR